MKWDCEPDGPGEPTEKPEAEEGHKQAADSQEAPEEPDDWRRKTRRIAHDRPYPAARTDAEDQRLHKLTPPEDGRKMGHIQELLKMAHALQEARRRDEIAEPELPDEKEEVITDGEDD